MSLGCSVADIFAVVKLARDLYKAIGDAPQQLIELQKELRHFQEALNELLLELDGKLEEFSEEYPKEWLQYLLQALQALACLLRAILWFILSGAVFSEFGKRKRPKCTTMPWDIWPSLVVLWGVCWMFYTPISDREQLFFQNSFEDDRFPGFVQDFSSYPFPISSQPLPGDLLYQDQFGDFDDAAGSSNLRLFGQNSFQAQDFQVDYDAPQSFGTLSDQPMDSGVEMDPRTSDPIWQLEMTSSTPNAATSHLSMPSQTASPRVTMSPDAPSPVLQPSHENQSANGEPGSPPRNAGGKFICTGFGCDDGITFNKRSDWQRHIDKHIRPFHCPEHGCMSKSATRGVLKRHLIGVHKKTSSESSSMSKRSERVFTSAHVNGNIASFGEVTQNPVLNKGKGVAKRSLAPSDNSQQGDMESAETRETEKSPKKVRLTENGGVQGTTSSECNESLVAENERLRRELELSRQKLEWQQEVWERERRMLLGVISGRKV